MKFSIIVTTTRRPREIRHFLQSLEAQIFRDFEVILGDQDSDPSLAKYVSALSFPSIYIPLESCSLSQARNRLLPFARGDIVALGDDDCLYQPDLLERVALVTAQNQSAAAFICTPKASKSQYGVVSISRKNLFYAAPSIAIFFNAEWMRKAGNFDEHMGIGAESPWQSGEETDLLLRIQNLGGQILRCLSIERPWHPDVDLSKDSTFCKASGYGMGRMYLLQKHGFSLWFKLCNIFYPLCLLPVEFMKKGYNGAKLRWAMFTGRLKGFFLAR